MNFAELKIGIARDESEAEEAVFAGLGEFVGSFLKAIWERFWQRLLIETGPCFAIVRSFQRPFLGVALGHIVGASQRVAREFLRLEKFGLPDHRLAGIGHAPFALIRAIIAAADRVAGVRRCLTGIDARIADADSGPAAIAARMSARGRDADASAGRTELQEKIAQDLVAAELIFVAPAADAIGVLEVGVEQLRGGIKVAGKNGLARGF